MCLGLGVATEGLNTLVGGLGLGVLGNRDVRIAAEGLNMLVGGLR